MLAVTGGGCTPLKLVCNPVNRHRDEEVKQEQEPSSLDQRAKHVNTGVNVEVEKCGEGYTFLFRT